MDSVVISMDVLPPAERKVPSNRLPKLHILHNAIRDLEIDSMWSVGLLYGVPPLLPVRINPSPVGVSRAAQGNISAGDFEPVTGESLKYQWKRD